MKSNRLFDDYDTICSRCGSKVFRILKNSVEALWCEYCGIINEVETVPLRIKDGELSKIRDIRNDG